MEELKKAFDAIGNQMDLITNSINKPVVDAKKDDLSECCGAMILDSRCASCKEIASVY